MRKIFTLILFACCSLISMAQQLSFVADGKTLENGSKYVSDKVEITPVGPLGNKYFFDLGVSLKAEKAGNVVVSVTSNRGEIQFCSLDGQCIVVKAGEIVKKTGHLNSGVELDLEIHHDAGFIQEVNPIITTEAVISAWYEDAPNEKISLNIVMSNDPTVTAVDAVEAASAQITFADGILAYQFAKAGQYTLSLYTLSGEKVMQQTIEGESGKLSLPLHQGVYVYTINEGAACPAKGKILVK